MKWVDVNEIAIELSEKYPETDPLSVLFTDLKRWVEGLDGFEDDTDRCGEKVLEAIQMAWLDEVD
ncbi:MAG: Fe-S cluster assembly protein IscX [Pseudomonadota bacterium]|jgi:FeS assembly protein IscX|uniref:Fe-S assembly protein IscX n=1 Tax=marine metagenome TaxID=408172 RepID=A0A382WCC7_9ZZZZ|nr:Fe-S cluster assembly protein IscX [Pseudomonadales bacterium]MEC7367661.1 Fe-S cluster assembly protein IscX [Pseudomonadota bacterium]|tara:strand:- start:265 stop:459 length:195 start_codon:yes stop_codon:yes gene_type:complete